MTLPISVVLCSYNGARFIEEQVNSILQQTYPIQELIVCDDGSTDETVEIITQIRQKDSRLTLYVNPVNLGFSANFEQALRLAKGECIAIADQDDIWHLEKLDRMMGQWHAGVPLIYCNSIRFAGAPPVDPQPNRKNRRIEGSDPRMLSVFNTVSGHAMIIRKSLLDIALPVPEKVYYDWWLAMNAMCNGGIQYVPDMLVFQRAHDSNVTIQQHLSEAQLRQQFREVLLPHLTAFARIKGIDSAHRSFFEQLRDLWSRSLNHRFNPGLFLFMLRNRTWIYANKVRSFPIISQLKNSFLFAFRLLSLGCLKDVVLDQYAL